jgi:hypothetical protein
MNGSKRVRQIGFGDGTRGYVKLAIVELAQPVNDTANDKSDKRDKDDTEELPQLGWKHATLRLVDGAPVAAAGYKAPLDPIGRRRPESLPALTVH